MEEKITFGFWLFVTVFNFFFILMCIPTSIGMYLLPPQKNETRKENSLYIFKMIKDGLKITFLVK